MKFTDCIEIAGAKPAHYKGTKLYVSTGAVEEYFINEKSIEEYSYKERPSRADLVGKSGDILFAKMAETKKTLILDKETENYLFSTGFFAIRPKNGILTTKCLYYLLNSKNFLNQKDKNSSGATQKAITNAGLEKINVNIPLFSKQDQIVKQFDLLTDIIKKYQSQLKKLDTLIKSRFIEMFGDPVLNPMGWEEVRITELCKNPDDIKCGPFGTQLSKDEYQKKGVPIFGIPQINSSFRVLPTDFLTNSKAEKLDAYSLIYGDIAMSRKGNVGKCAIYSGKEKGIIHSDVVRLRVDDAICNSIYLMNQLHINQKVETQISNVSSGAIMAGINVTKMKDIIVYNPPLSLQNDFASFVQQIDKSKFEIANSLKRLYNKGMLS